MKLWMAKLTIILFGFFLLNCSRKTNYNFGSSPILNHPSYQSKLLSLKTVGIGDTVVARVSGTITGKDSANKKVQIDSLLAASIFFIRHDRNDTLIAMSEKYGKYEKYLEAGTYDILVKHVGYEGLMIKNVPLSMGELKMLDVQLGAQGQIIVESGIDTEKLNCNSYYDKKLNYQAFTVVDKMPQFGKGPADLLLFFSKNFVYPNEQLENFQGSVTVSFIVAKDGQLKNIDVDNKFFLDSYSPVDLEAIRIFKLMPVWTPGQCNGVIVPVKMKIPIKF